MGEYRTAQWCIENGYLILNNNNYPETGGFDVHITRSGGYLKVINDEHYIVCEEDDVRNVMNVPSEAIRPCLAIRNDRYTPQSFYIDVEEHQRHFASELNCYLMYFRERSGTLEVVETNLTNIMKNREHYGAGYNDDVSEVLSLGCPNYGTRYSNVETLTSFVVSANLPIFANIQQAQRYLIEGHKEEVTSEKEWIMHTKAYSCNDILGSGGTLLTENVVNIKESIPVNGSSGRICGYVQNTGLYNIVLVWDDKFAEQTSEVLQTENGRTQGTSLNTLVIPRNTYSVVVKDDNFYSYGEILGDTNIPIYRSEGDAQSYLQGGNPTPIYSGGGGGSGESNIGDDDPATEFNDSAENQPVLSSVYLCNKSGLEAFGRVLYSTDTDIVDAVTEGLKRYGENPINFIVSCFYVPFDVSTFCTRENTRNVPFGSYNATLDMYVEKVTHNNARVTIANVSINGAYNDYRDYEFNYYLYLPYVGICPLDIEQVIYKNLRIDCFFDIRTGNIKYYIMANQSLVKTFEGNINVGMPLTGADKSAQASQYINGIESIAGGIASAGATVGSAVATEGASLIGSTGMLNPYTSIINGALELHKGAPKSISGNASPSTAIKDPLYPYLIIEKPKYTDANATRSKFNLPDHTTRYVRDVKGFFKMSDVIIDTLADEQETAEIISLLTSGCFN